jgi:ribosomal protein L23
MASKIVANAFHEVFHNKPSTVKTSKSPAGQRKQMIAIALSKARAAGAHVPMKKGISKLGAKR